MFLDWISSGAPYQAIARTYDVGKSTVWHILHEVVEVLADKLVPLEIKFPPGDTMVHAMNDFRRLCKLPCCLGAIDGTFVRIEKP